VRFTPDSQDREAPSLHGMSGDLPAVSFNAAFLPYEQAAPELPPGTMQVIPAEPEAGVFEEATSSTVLKLGDGVPIELRHGRMAAPLKALRTCVDDLHTSWGIDPAVQKSSHAHLNPAPGRSSGSSADIPAR
jgi:hypothetical protein